MEHISEILDGAVEYAKKNGIKIVRGDWGVRQTVANDWEANDGACCILGAALVSEQSTLSNMEPTYAVVDMLGVSLGWVDVFVRAFDGEPLLPSAHTRYKDAVDLGEKYAAKVFAK